MSSMKHLSEIELLFFKAEKSYFQPINKYLVDGYPYFDSNKISYNTYEKDFFFAKEITLQKDAKKTSRIEFDKVMELYRKDPIGFISAESGTPRNRIAMGSSTTGVSHNVINNPIELPEKN